jgi:hypothetical protein
MAPSAPNDDTPSGDGLTIPTNEAPTATTMWPTKQHVLFSYVFTQKHGLWVVRRSRFISYVFVLLMSFSFVYVVNGPGIYPISFGPSNSLLAFMYNNGP